MFTLRIFLFTALTGSAASAYTNQPGHLGLGGIIGEPTGISAKYVIDERFAVQGALGLSVVEKGFWVSSDLLLQFHNVFSRDGKWPLYVGGGLVIQDRGNRGKTNRGEASLGVRAVAGVEFHAADRLSLFGEASIQPFIIPSIDFGIALAVGARYWF